MSKRENRENEMTAEKAAAEIARAYRIRRAQSGSSNEWVMIADVADLVDLSAEWMQAGCAHLNRQAGWHVIPESNQKSLTGRERAAAVRIGNQDKHLIAWM